MAKKEIKNKETVNVDGKIYRKEKFLIEESHPAIGRILIIENLKFKVLDEASAFHKSGTFIAPLTKRDEVMMKEYDDDLEKLSEKLVDRIDIKRLIKENIKNKRHQEIKTGLFILKAKEDGEEVEEEHLKGCYNYKAHYKSQTFDFTGGIDIEGSFSL